MQMSAEETQAKRQSIKKELEATPAAISLELHLREHVGYWGSLTYLSLSAGHLYQEAMVARCLGFLSCCWRRELQLPNRAQV